MRNLTSEFIKELFPTAAIRSYDRGQIVCYQGDKPQHVFFVAKGHIRYYDIDEEGNEKILHLIGPNNIFPMLYAFGVTEDVAAFYGTIDAASIITVPLDEFSKAAQTNIELANALTRWFLTEINQLVYRISSLEKTEARAKILYALKYLALNYGESKGTWQHVNVPVTHQFIANFTGLARETVSATMHDLVDERLIKSGKNHKLEVKRSELKKIH